ncbi:MAG: glycerate kinase [Bacteroidales bacterium]|nr:glycerate kinase [Bacteroidales bacterium]
MRVIVAPDSFKGSLTAAEAADAICDGVLDAMPDCDVTVVPLADGGEGTSAVLARAYGCRQIVADAVDPLGRPIKAAYALSADGMTAIIDVASASGLTLVEPRYRNPLTATTRGTGMLIADALDRGACRIMVGLGGSATNDGGRGMLEALGYSFGDDESIDDSRRHRAIDRAAFVAVCDVDTPMCGPTGASHVFGPQKGASPLMVDRLERRMQALATVYSSYGGMDIASMLRGGAAGGTAGALAAVLGAGLCSGIDVVLEAVGFDRLITGADLVITGEGRIDSQTLMGKTVAGVLAAGIRADVAVAAIGGTIEWGTDLADAPFAALIEAKPVDMSLAEAMRCDVAGQNLRKASKWLITSM